MLRLGSTLGNARWIAAKAVGLAGLALTAMGCELLGGIDQRSLAASAVGSGDGGSSDSSVYEAAPPPTGLYHCTLTGTGTGLVRFGNMVPTPQRVDVCMRPSSAATFDGIKPLFAAGGESCSAGLGYKDVTVSIAVAPDSYEVHIVPAGQGCDAAPLASLTSALIVDKQPTSLHLLGNGQQAPTLRRYVESRPSQPSSSVMRFLNAAPDLGSLDFGLADGAALPAKIAAGRILKMGFGDATPNDPSQTAVDANGYVAQQIGSGRFNYGLAPTGTTDAELLAVRSIASGKAYSFFAVGRTNTPDFPLQLFACDETGASSSVIASCSDAPPETFTVDAVNLQLSGATAVSEGDRRPAGYAAVAALPSDYVCLTEIYRQEDKDAVIAAAKNQFPYSYAPALNEQTPATDSRNLAGAVNPLPKTPPCAASQAKMTTLINCMRDYCSTVPGDESGVAVQNPSACLSQNCATGVLSLVDGNTDDSTCWGCVLSTYNSYETMGNMRTRCTTEPLGALGFHGQSGVMMLSRRPLTNTDFFLMPPMGIWQTTAARATTALDNGASVDLYCAAGVGIPTDCTLSHVLSPVGANADGTMPKDCIGVSNNEQILFNTRMRDWVATHSGGQRNQVVFSGDLYSGPSYQDSVQALHSDNFGIFSAAFSLGTASTFIPECTDCATNPIRTPPGGQPSGDNTWTRFNLLQNIPVTSVQSNQVILKDATVASNPGNGASAIPISSYYGFRSVLTIVP